MIALTMLTVFLLALILVQARNIREQQRKIRTLRSLLCDAILAETIAVEAFHIEAEEEPVEIPIKAYELSPEDRKTWNNIEANLTSEAGWLNPPDAPST